MYYKDDTHDFVMTAKKQCLLRLGVLHQVGPRPRQGGLNGGPWEVGSRPGHGLPLGVEGVHPVCSGTFSTSVSSSPLRLTWPLESYSGLNTIYQSQHCTP